MFVVDQNADNEMQTRCLLWFARA